MKPLLIYRIFSKVSFLDISHSHYSTELDFWEFSLVKAALIDEITTDLRKFLKSQLIGNFYIVNIVLSLTFQNFDFWTRLSEMHIYKSRVRKCEFWNSQLFGYFT